MLQQVASGAAQVPGVVPLQVCAPASENPQVPNPIAAEGKHVAPPQQLSLPSEHAELRGRQLPASK